jgi:hypothetical protein
MLSVFLLSRGEKMKKREERREKKKRKKKGINFHKIKERVVFTPRDNGKKTTIRKGATRDERVNHRKREREREREREIKRSKPLFVCLLCSKNSNLLQHSCPSFSSSSFILIHHSHHH